MLGIARDAGADLQRDVRARHLQTGAQTISLLLGPLEGLTRVVVRQPHDELVTAEVPEHLLVVEALAQCRSRELHHVVAGPMAERGDDAVQAIEADAHDAQRLAARDRIAQQADREIAVRQAREAVVVCLMKDVPLAIGDRVLHRVEAARQLAELVGRVHVDRLRVHTFAHSPSRGSEKLHGARDRVREPERTTDRE